jgi:hypothetical protein
MFNAVDAFPCGSRSITSTRRPLVASAAAMFTVVVVLPTPPFWFATTNTRVSAGLGRCEVAWTRRARSTCSWAAAAKGVESSSKAGRASSLISAAELGA